MDILNFLTVRKRKRIFAFIMCICFIFASFISIPRTTYASSTTINISDCTTWEQVTSNYGSSVSTWLKGIADSLGMTCSAFCTAVSTGAIALSPYIMATVVVGASAYLGYDIYENYDTISDQILTELVGGSAYADYWFQEYAEGILDGTYDLSKGIEVPVDIFNSMTMALSTVLTYDLSSTFENKNTCIRSSTATLTATEIGSWLNTLGYEGTYSSNMTINNPVICMYNQASQEYFYFIASGYYDTDYTDLLLCEVAGTLYAQIQNSTMVNDIGYGLEPIGNSSVIWSSYKAGATGTQGLTAQFDLSNLTIDDGIITYLYNGLTYTISILCPSTCSIVLGNLTYSELEFPLSYFINAYSMISVLPWYWQVTGISVEDMSTLDTNVNTMPTDIPSDYVDAIDTAITTDTTIPLDLPIGRIADWVSNPAIEDTTAITDAITDTTPVEETDTGILSGLVSGIKSLIEKIIEILQKILEGILSIPSILSNIWDFIQTIPGLIIDGISAALEALFIPSAECVAEMQDLLDKKMPFIGDIYSWVDELMQIMQSPEDYASNLTFTVDMSKSENTYWNYGSSKSNAISATWYLKYKDTVDDIIIGIAWLIFLWNVHCQLPSIISAVSSTTFASANLEYQKYSVNTRTKKMNEAKEKEKAGDE